MEESKMCLVQTEQARDLNTHAQVKKWGRARCRLLSRFFTLPSTGPASPHVQASQRMHAVLEQVNAACEFHCRSRVYSRVLMRKKPYPFKCRPQVAHREPNALQGSFHFNFSSQLPKRYLDCSVELYLCHHRRVH